MWSQPDGTLSMPWRFAMPDTSIMILLIVCDAVRCLVSDLVPVNFGGTVASGLMRDDCSLRVLVQTGGEGLPNGSCYHDGQSVA